MSAILSADDLNDFISPGVACIKPVQNVSGSKDGQQDEVEIQIDQDGEPLEVSKADGEASKLNPAQISLSDCLACSGCITSAEEVLVAQHSHNELTRALEENRTQQTKKVFVASVSHQSRASLAGAYGVSVAVMDKLLIDLFVAQMGFTHVVGTSLGRSLSLIYEAQNIIDRKTRGVSGPTLSSVCPGWVLYAEKTHPYVIPHMSDVKSPQQITGCLLKSLVARELGISRDNIYHVSIMPCFDKKLESARPEKYDGELPSPDVDCVLTPKELVTLIEENTNIYSLIPPHTDITKLPQPASMSNIYKQVAPKTWPSIELAWASNEGSSSGGYAYHYLAALQLHLMASDPSVYNPQEFELVTVGGRNSDVYEMRLLFRKEKVGSAAVVNGFKNIQNLVRRLKPSKSTVSSNPLANRRRARLAKANKSDDSSDTDQADPSKCDYVEIMACPNGCINGGGQISPPGDVSAKEWLASIIDRYRSIETISLFDSPDARAVSDIIHWSLQFIDEFNISEMRLSKTYFNTVEKPTDQATLLLGTKW